jgi:hypothetical protein
MLRGCTILLLAIVLRAAGDPPGPRVVVLLGGNQDARGYLVTETSENVELRDRAGTLLSFPRSRVLRLVRLLDPPPDPAAPVDGTVILRDGQRRSGRVVEDGFDEVVLDIDGIRARFPREEVEAVVLLPGFEERYAQYRAAARTAAQRLDLCRWLVRERRYELARSELEPLAASDPSREASELLGFVRAQLDLEAQAPPSPPVPGRGGDDEGDPAEDLDAPDAPGAPGAPGAPSRIISRKDVNLIRVYEIDLDRPPRLVVGAETIRTLIDRYAANPAIPGSEAERRALFRAEPVEVVELMFRLRARDLYPGVEVISEPWSLNLFRERVHNTWLLNTCATAACHGGGDGGRFQLHRRRYRDERVRYTNLLLLERLDVGLAVPLVNYEDPELSLIIQHGLPRAEARYPHPAVDGWSPIFERSGKRMQRDTVKWIESMVRPRPAYPVILDPVSAPGPAPLPPVPPDAGPAAPPGPAPR